MVLGLKQLPLAKGSRKEAKKLVGKIIKKSYYCLLKNWVDFFNRLWPNFWDGLTENRGKDLATVLLLQSVLLQ
jgi:hypothetical protein